MTNNFLLNKKYIMKNPIKNNRIVEDIYFATILNDTLHKILKGDIVSHIDVEYLTFISDDLLAYQRHTCTEQKEKDYFERIGKPLTEIIAKDKCDISELVGKTITSIDGLEEGSDKATFVCSDGTKFVMYHEQECCEEVSIDDVCGDVEDLIGSPILKAEEVSNSSDIKQEEDENYHCSATWTFYHLHTMKGTVTIKWYGTSNGCYSEKADFVKVYKAYK